MSEAFAEVIDEAMKRKGWGYNRLSVEIGLLEGNRIFNPTQIRRLRLGERQNLSRELVQRLIDVLDLPEEEAWHASGLWPPDLDVAGYRRYRHHALAPAKQHSRGTRRIPAELAPVIALPVPPGLDEQIDGLRPRDQWRWADRRKHDRRGWRRVLEPAA